MDTTAYDPFARGRFPVGERTIQAPDLARGRLFLCEIWYPAHTGEADRPASSDAGRDTASRPGAYPLIVFSHYSGGHRRSATFLMYTSGQSRVRRRRIGSLRGGRGGTDPP
jgi:hypothetical protein